MKETKRRATENEWKDGSFDDSKGRKAKSGRHEPNDAGEKE